MFQYNVSDKKPRGYRVDCPILDDWCLPDWPEYSISKYAPENYKDYPAFLTINLFSLLSPVDNKTAFKVGHVMIELAKKENGQGLAANQIDFLSPLMVMIIGSKWKIFYRPALLEASQELILKEEGCLSFPGITREIERPMWVKFSAIVSKSGKRKIYIVYGDEARCFMHEYNHLLGKTILCGNQ